MPGRKAHLPEPLTYEKFSAIMKDAGVDRAILVPPSWEGERVDYSLEAAQKYPDRFAVMGRFPIEKPSERDKLETWRDQKGMLGVRLTLHHEWDRGWMKDGTACIAKSVLPTMARCSKVLIANQAARQTARTTLRTEER